MESDGVDLDLAGSALLHDKFVPGWSTLASSAFVWPFAEFLLGFFLKPLCRNSFLCQKHEKQHFQPFSQFLRKQKKLYCSHRIQRLVRVTEGHPGVWLVFRVFLLKLSFCFFLKRSHIIIFLVYKQVNPFQLHNYFNRLEIV